MSEKRRVVPEALAGPRRAALRGDRSEPFPFEVAISIITEKLERSLRFNLFR